MTLGLPLALLGLLALPLVWWFHRRLRTPPEVVLPSLMFLLDEDDASKLPSGRRFDAELVLALTATALLAIAAAGPALVRSEPRRVVRVVVSGGAPATMEGYAEAVRETVDVVRDALAPHDELELRWLPAVGSTAAKRPSEEALLAAAMAGEASARLVVSDQAPRVDTGAITWLAVGAPRTSNTGIVAVSAEQTADGTEVFCAVAHHGPEAARGRVELSGTGSQPFTIAPGRIATFRFRAQAQPSELRLRSGDGGDYDDALDADDRVFLRRDARRILVDPGLPDELIRRVGAASVAAGRPDAVAPDAPPPVLYVRRRGADVGHEGWVLELEPVAQGAQAERAPEGLDALGQEPLVADLSTAGIEWVYVRGAAEVREGERVLLGRRVGDRLWPVVLVKDRVVRFAPDPLRGEPKAVDTPFWPLLFDNLLAVAAGRGIGGGLHARGLLDPASTKPGDARIPFDADVVARAKPSVPARDVPLRPLLVAAALVCLALLWAAPRIRRRLTPRPALAGQVGSDQSLSV